MRRCRIRRCVLGEKACRIRKLNELVEMRTRIRSLEDTLFKVKGTKTCRTCRSPCHVLYGSGQRRRKNVSRMRTTCTSTGSGIERDEGNLYELGEGLEDAINDRRKKRGHFVRRKKCLSIPSRNFCKGLEYTFLVGIRFIGDTSKVNVTTCDVELCCNASRHDNHSRS